MAAVPEDNIYCQCCTDILACMLHMIQHFYMHIHMAVAVLVNAFMRLGRTLWHGLACLQADQLI